MKREMIEGDTYRPYMLCVASLVPEWLESVETLKPGPKLCYARLARHEGKEGSSFPGLKSLAASLGTNERQVQRWVAELKKEKLIAVKQRGLGQTNVYTFLVHPFMDGAKLPQGGTVEVTRREDPSRQLSPVREDDPGVLDPPVMVNIRESVEENQGRESEQEESGEESLGSQGELREQILRVLNEDMNSSDPKLPKLSEIVLKNSQLDQRYNSRIELELCALLEQIGVEQSALRSSYARMMLDDLSRFRSNMIHYILQARQELIR